MTRIVAIITALDNLPNLKESVNVLRDEPIDEIVVVNNGSIDGTRDWLNGQKGLTVVHRENRGAGPGRNSGLDAAEKFDFALMLDGGIRPLRGGTQRLLEYLERHANVDVIGVHIPDFETDYEKAWRRWPYPIQDQRCFRSAQLSYTAYCLTRARAWDGLRFSEEGPFGEAGWGADDDQMANTWRRAGIVVHVVQCACNLDLPCTGVHPYRRASGSFTRLYEETGIWPNQYGSTYEKRVVWLNQNDCDLVSLDQWGEPWLTVVVEAQGIDRTARIVKRAHELLRRRRFGEGWSNKWNPYSILVWANNQGEPFREWAKVRRLRQHHGDTVVYPDGSIVRRNDQNEELWTGDFRVTYDNNWVNAIRPGAFYYALVRSVEDVENLVKFYDTLHSPQPNQTCIPSERGELERQEWAQGE